MFEKVNPSHPDKVADRIAGAIVDYAHETYGIVTCAVEVLLGHGHCYIIIESDAYISQEAAQSIVWRIVGRNVFVHLVNVPQDHHLADNQRRELRCGDNGIFCGMPITEWRRFC